MAGSFTADTAETIELFTTNAVEILHEDATDLPIPICSAAAVQDLEVGMMLVCGTTHGKTPLDSFLWLVHAGGVLH